MASSPTHSSPLPLPDPPTAVPLALPAPLAPTTPFSHHTPFFFLSLSHGFFSHTLFPSSSPRSTHRLTSRPPISSHTHNPFFSPHTLLLPLSLMASSPTHSSPLPLPLPDPPTAVPLALPAPLAILPSTRRLPPPCWSPDETLALIDAYRDKWYSLGRGNLKATHWQEVADTIAQRCPNASPSKTPVQCRHKMEKLRKRYRTEIQRARSLPVSRFNSSWIHFKLMDSMEKGPKPDHNDSDSPDDDEDDQDQDLYDEIKNGHGSNTRSLNKLYKNGFGGGGGGGGSGFRIRFPPTQPESKYSSDMKYNPNLNPNYGNTTPMAMRNVSGNVSGNKRERSTLGDLVSAIKLLGDGFVKMEQMKMEMAREIEAMRMEMEMKRTEMILNSQHRIVEAFAKAVSDNSNDNSKKKTINSNKRIPSPQQP